MTTAITGRIRLVDLAPNPGDARAEFLAGLRQNPKRIAPKFFYDEHGSNLFDRICELDEYYPTRTEISILRKDAESIAQVCGPRCRFVELGSGSSTKTPLLLDQLDEPACYIPVDISRPHLVAAAERMAERYDRLDILPVCADYSQPLCLPEPLAGPAERTEFFFPGSTIGNFAPPEAEAFLRTIAGSSEPGDRMLIGVDLVKDPRILHAAYNDRHGVTAEFNLNLLRRANDEFGANFRPELFAHEAIYDVARTRIEMRLVSSRKQFVEIGGERFRFEQGESVVTEHSCKYTRDAFEALAARGGWTTLQTWTDPRGWFGVFALELDMRV